MRALKPVLLVLMLWPVAVTADACREEIAAMFDGGPLDPFARPPWRQVKEIYAEDGSLGYIMDSLAVDPVHQVSGIRDSGQFLMMIGRESWRGPSPEGPWTPSGMTLTEDMLAAQKAVAPSMAANLSETECLGTVERDGRTLIAYGFRTKVDPHPARGNSWWGSKDVVYLDPETRLPVIWEQTEHIASWAEGVKNERHVSTLTYPDDIEITPPE